ncbi:MAG: hypothetical protein ACOH5I_08375 [Oligoflexus sp.]
MKLFLRFLLLNVTFIVGIPTLQAQSEPSLQIFTSSNTKTSFERIQDMGGDGNHASLLSLTQDIRIRFSEFGEGPRVNFGYQLEIDLEDDQQDDLLEKNFDRLRFAVDRSYSHGEYGLGLKILSWGETASLPILDVTNPRNLDHPKGFYDPAAKISVPMVTANVNLADWQISTFLNFWPQNPRYPEEVGGFKVKEQKEKTAFRDFEGGVRVGRTIDNLDLKLMYVKHEARVPSFIISAFAEDGDLQLNRDKIDTFGLSYSWAGFEHVLRGDLRYSFDHPVNGVMQKKTVRDLKQAIFGYDYSPNINTVLGLEAHMDDWGLMPYHFAEGPFAVSQNENARLLWFGTNSRMNFNNNKFEARLLYLKGLTNEDSLMRLRFEIKPTDKINLSIEAQKTSFKASSPQYVLSEQERLLLGAQFFL